MPKPPRRWRDVLRPADAAPWVRSVFVCPLRTYLPISRPEILCFHGHSILWPVRRNRNVRDPAQLLCRHIHAGKMNVADKPVFVYSSVPWAASFVLVLVIVIVIVIEAKDVAVSPYSLFFRFN